MTTARPREAPGQWRAAARTAVSDWPSFQFVCDQSSSVALCMQNYKSLRLRVVSPWITDRQTSFGQLHC